MKIPRIKAMGWPRDIFYHSKLYPKTSLRPKEFSKLISILGETFLINTGGSCSKGRMNRAPEKSAHS